MMKQFAYLSFILIPLMAGCGSAGGVEMDSPASVSGENILALDGMTEFSLDSQGARLSTGEINPEDTYVVSLYTTNQESNSIYTYGLGHASVASQASMSALMGQSERFTEDFHGALRAREENLDPAAAVKPSTLKMLASGELPLGSTRAFKVITDTRGEQYEEVQATLRYANQDFHVYVDARNADSISDEELEEAVSPFAARLADQRALFGLESDVNGDGRFAVLMTQAVNELGGSGGGMLTGFFYAADLYDAGIYPVSNEMDILYAMVPDPSGEFGPATSRKFAVSNILPSVLPHELQHMIHYNERVLTGKKAADATFLNEGLAHLAEDIYSYDGATMAAAGVENPARVAEYLKAIHSTCFTCGSSLAQRGGIYLFLRYLYEQAEAGRLPGARDGEDFIDRLIHSPRAGVANILESALNDAAPSRFKDLMAPFSLALYLSNTGYAGEGPYQFTGISLRGPQKDRRGTVLSGPAVLKADSLPYVGTVRSSTVAYVQVTGEELIGADQDGFPLAVEEGLTGGGYLMRVGGAQ